MALMFLSNLNSFNSSPSPPKQRFNSRKGSSSKPKFGKKKAQSDSVTFPLSPFMFLHYLFVLLLLGSKTLGLNVLELHFAMLANYDQNV